MTIGWRVLHQNPMREYPLGLDPKDGCIMMLNGCALLDRPSCLMPLR